MRDCAWALTGGRGALTRTAKHGERDVAALHAHRPGARRGCRAGRLGVPWANAPTDPPNGDQQPRQAGTKNEQVFPVMYIFLRGSPKDVTLGRPMSHSARAPNLAYLVFHGLRFGISMRDLYEVK